MSNSPEKKSRRPFYFGCLLGFVLGVVTPVACLLSLATFFRDSAIPYMAAIQREKLSVPPITSGLQADYNWTVTDIDGATIDLAGYAGKPLFLNFWRPSCIACVAELPAINALYKELGDQVSFVTIAVSDTENLRFFIAQERLEFPVYTAPGPIPDVFDFNATPATFCIAPSGEIVFKHIGGAKWDDPSAVSFLRGLAEK